MVVHLEVTALLGYAQVDECAAYIERCESLGDGSIDSAIDGVRSGNLQPPTPNP
jgi:hypothetical protein